MPDEHALTAVVHAAGGLEERTNASLTPEQVDRVMQPKVDAALNLHELTAGLEMSDFVLFSSLSSIFSTAGQGNYAAANAFLDALAERRRAEGLPARSLAWGLWTDGSGMTGGMTGADRA